MIKSSSGQRYQNAVRANDEQTSSTARNIAYFIETYRQKDGDGGIRGSGYRCRHEHRPPLHRFEIPPLHRRRAQRIRRRSNYDGGREYLSIHMFTLAAVASRPAKVQGAAENHLSAAWNYIIFYLYCSGQRTTTPYCLLPQPNKNWNQCRILLNHGVY